MASITTTGSGDWSSTTPNAPWPSGIVPSGGSGGDGVTIAKNHIVTLDATTNACKSLALALGTSGSDVGGKLACKTDRDTKLAIYNGIVANGSTGGATYGAFSSEVALDISGAPTYKCEIVPNGAGITTSTAAVQIKGKFTLKGAARQRWAFTTAPLTAGVTDTINISNVTGWRAGDKLVFATTQAYNASPKYSEAVIDSIGTITGTAADVTLTAPITNSHDSGCLVGNFTSNLRFFPPVDYNACCINLNPALNNAGSLSNAEFYKGGPSTSFGWAGNLVLQPGSFTGSTVDSCAFYQFKSQAVFSYASDGGIERSNNQYFTTQAASLVFAIQSPIGALGDESDMCVYAATPASTNGAISLAGAGLRIVRPKVSGVTGNAAFSNITGYGDARVVGGGVWACLAVDQRLNTPTAAMYFDGTYLGKGIEGHVYASANNANISKITGSGNAIYTSCPENLSGGARADATAGAVTSETVFYNRDNDAANQDIYRIKISASAPVFVRDAAVANRANASMRVDTLGSATTFERTFDLLVKAGEAATIFIYARKNAAFNDGTNTRPTATLSGLGITPITATMTDVDDTWEKLDLSYAEGAAPSADGNLTLTLSCQSSTAGAKAYFSGIPIPPFVTRCRHYGYLFDETTPTRTANITTSASEATAAAYSGIAVTWDTDQSDTAITAARTFQELYDYTQAQACLNVTSALPLTGAGVAGSPALFAAGDITLTGSGAISGSGSLSMGAFTLATASYTYTGGTFSQLASTPAFAGGTIELPTMGTYDYTFSGCTVEFGAAGTTWNLSDAAFSGTVHFTTATGALAVTVAVPSGITYTTEGANITVTEPVLSAPIAWAGALDGTTCLLYNDSAAGTIIDTQTISGAGGYSLAITLPHADVAVGDSLRLRFGHKEYYAGELQGTMTATGLTFVGDMTLHPVYAAWGFNGAMYDQGYTPPGPYVMDGTNLQVDIAAGATTGLKTQLGAWTQHLMTIPAGLAAFYGAWDLLAVNQIRQNVDVVDVKIDVPTAGALFEYTDNNVNYYRSDYTFPGNVEAGHGLIAMTYNASIFVPPPTIISGESVVTGTPETVADAVRTELATELADITKARKLAQNKKVLDPATGVQKVYDDDGTTVLGQGNAYMDADGTELYDGGGPVHRTERLT